MRAVVTGILLALLQLWSDRYAQACTCEAQRFVSPQDGASEVPTNAEIVVSAPVEVVLRDSSSTTVVISQTQTWRDDEVTLVAYRPSSYLLPNQEYSIYDGGELRSTFRTGAESDSESPATPTIGALRIAQASMSAQSTCGDVREQVSMDAELSSDTAWVDIAFPASPSVEFLVPPDNLDSLGSPDKASCRIGTPLAAGADYCLDITARDLAGNVSAPTRICSSVVECAAVTDPNADLSHCDPPGCCSAGDNGQQELVLGAMVVLLWRLGVRGRRRRRAGSTSARR